MKTTLALVIALTAWCASAAPLRFLSFNIYGYGEKEGMPPSSRSSGVEESIVKCKADVISLQEVAPAFWNGTPLFAHLAADFGIVRGNEKEALLRAGAAGSYRLASWVNHEPLLYRKNRLKLLDSGLDFFHLSLQAEKSVTWGVLEDLTDGRRFIAFATHFWWQGNGPESDAIRELNARHVLSRIADVRRKWGDLPVIGGGSIELTGDIVSMPYIQMTAAVMQDMGADVDITSRHITIGKGYTGNDYPVEGDWSAAAPWYALAALLSQSQLSLEGLSSDSIQGDSRLVELGKKLGIMSRFDAHGVTLDTSGFIGCCCSSFADMAATPDLVPSWAVLMCLLERSFRMTGVRTLRLKESDRLTVLREELLKLGYVLKIENEDAISWYGEKVPVTQEPPVINPHGDHRIAMAFAPAAVRFPGLVIADAGVTSKSYPAFWRHLEKSGFTIHQLAQ